MGKEWKKKKKKIREDPISLSPSLSRFRVDISNCSVRNGLQSDSRQVINERFYLLSSRTSRRAAAFKFAIVEIGETARQPVKPDLFSSTVCLQLQLHETVFTISCNVRLGELRNPIIAVTDDVTMLQRIVIADSISVSQTRADATVALVRSVLAYFIDSILSKILPLTAGKLVQLLKI